MKKLNNKAVGFIGLGRMGKHMAANLLKAGFSLVVYDIREEPLAEIEKLGARIANSTIELGQESDLVIVMVTDYDQVKKAVLAPEGALKGMKRGSTLIIMSTISPIDVKEIGKWAKEQGITILDAPISGLISEAESGKLTIMVGGSAAALRNNKNVLSAMGKNIYHVGKFGMGETVKMINQIMAMVNTVGVMEAMVIAEKLEVNLETLYEVVTHGSGDSRQFRNRAPKIIRGDFTAEGVIDILVKDTGIIVNTATELGIPLPVSIAAYHIFRMAQSRGLGKLHPAALIKLYEHFAQLDKKQEYQNIY